MSIYYSIIHFPVTFGLATRLLLETSQLWSFCKLNKSEGARARAGQSACELRGERKTGNNLENANSSPPLQCSMAWQRGRIKPHKASPTKLHFLFCPLPPSSSFPPPLHSHTDPILCACLFGWDWFCKLGEYYMLWCYIQQIHSTTPLTWKSKVLYY